MRFLLISHSVQSKLSRSNDEIQMNTKITILHYHIYFIIFYTITYILKIDMKSFFSTSILKSVSEILHTIAALHAIIHIELHDNFSRHYMLKSI